MPVDIGLFRSEGGSDLDQVRQWQELRYGKTSENATTLLHEIQNQYEQRRVLLKELNTARSRANFIQKTQRGSSDENEAIETEVKGLKQHTIPSLERDLQQVSNELEQSLPKVANCVVDVDIPQPSQSVHKRAPTNIVKPNETVIDPLYCLGGYETIVAGGSSTVVVLTGTGAALAQSLSSYVMTFLRNDPAFASFEPVILPESIPLESSSSVAHSVIGCLSSSSAATCPQCKHPAQAPTLVSSLLLYQGKTFWDRQLPLGYVITTTTTGLEPTSILDNREQARIRSFQRGKKRSWFHHIATGERVELYCLTGNTVMESNEMQSQMVNAIVAFHQSLCSLSNSPLLRIRAVEPAQLLPCEASRIIIEGRLGKKQVILGYISNMTDYSTRGCKIQMGGALGYCHSVHGVICSIPETLEWVLAQNVVQVEDGEELGVVIPPCPLSLAVQEHLRMAPSHDGVLFLPFVRRVYHRNGKVTRTELRSASKPRVVPNSTPRSATSDRSKRPERAVFVKEGPITAQDIENERMSCPFGFLPIGYE